ncbi:MAG: macrolide ABC transporter ATP-binding protein [Candidatus Portnoybacteria bacterium CG10_big_fil_rev_8_21_14_0_10_44_7]|uniref:Macrolide ABC transporter ATP-binding protein n=1 Tax=Candidatus Portnoybacteria bacterium CG10_big_fil_rev_8_21_14_0_10_44_7 TaxID=1974816 RepID=A0A2M8KID0_9BACT|nr:MAG: macrolide ABC transporter ATP-binding protein [Candidatus Portnoybacteria bacterium CG10_big_fil_rev_8_21_14_0_10_44_7]
MELLKLNKITKTYRNPGSQVETQALEEISFALNEGEFLSIMGPSGSGKSTLMHIMGLLDRPSSGELFLRGQAVGQLTDDQAARIRNKEIGFVFQSFNLLPRVSVLENIILPLSYVGLAANQEKEMAQKVIAAVGMEHRQNFLPNQLSGGEQQRAAIARALVNNPSIIFADEPTGNLDSKSGQQVMTILQKLNKEGKTVVLVTHEQATAQHGTRMLQLKDGRLISDMPITNRRLAENEDGLGK